MEKKRQDNSEQFSEDDLKIVDTEIIREKSRSDNRISEYKVYFGMGIIGIILLISIISFFIFQDDGKKYAASISLINLILGSVLGYLYGSLREKRGS